MSVEFLMNALAIGFCFYIVTFGVDRFMRYHENEIVRKFRAMAVASVCTLTTSFICCIVVLFVGVPFIYCTIVALLPLSVATFSWWTAWTDPNASLKKKMRSAWIQTVSLDIMIGWSIAILSVGQIEGLLR